MSIFERIIKIMGITLTGKFQLWKKRKKQNEKKRNFQNLNVYRNSNMNLSLYPDLYQHKRSNPRLKTNIYVNTIFTF